MSSATLAGHLIAPCVRVSSEKPFLTVPGGLTHFLPLCSLPYQELLCTLSSSISQLISSRACTHTEICTDSKAVHVATMPCFGSLLDVIGEEAEGTRDILA